MSQDLLQLRLDLMARDGRFDPELLVRFGGWIRKASDDELYRVPLLQWAERHDVEEDLALDLFLWATKVGILEMSWGVLCPICGMLITTPGGLRALGPDPHCRVCRIEFPAALDDQVEVAFSLEPGIRRLRYFDPDRILDSERDWLKLFFSSSLVLGPMQEQMLKARAHDFSVAPGAVVTRELTWQPGMWIVVAPSVHAVASIVAHPDSQAREVSLDCLDGQFIPAQAGMGTGAGTLKVRNRSDYVLPVGVLFSGEHKTDRELPPPITMKPFLTGKRVLTNQTFRDLFRTETIGAGGLRIKNLAMVFSDLQASTALYERVGDLRALELVRSHFDRLHEVVARHRGAVVKTIGDAVMSVFGEPERALAAAAGMNRAVRRIDADGESLNLKVGVHAGSCIAIQTNHQIDYFGSAVNVAARVQGVARGGEIVVTDAIWQAPRVQGLAEDFGLAERADVVDLRGIAQGVPVHRLS